jgi:hypothetical protein
MAGARQRVMGERHPGLMAVGHHHAQPPVALACGALVTRHPAVDDHPAPGWS